VPVSGWIDFNRSLGEFKAEQLARAGVQIKLLPNVPGAKVETLLLGDLDLQGVKSPSPKRIKDQSPPPSNDSWKVVAYRIAVSEVDLRS